MAGKTRFQISKKDIINLFETKGKNIYSFSDLIQILDDNREFWRLPKRLTGKLFIDLLLKNTKLNNHIIQFPNNKFIKYTWVPVSIFKLILSINSKAYLSHYSAMQIHSLTEQIPKSIYINIEQSNKSQISNKLILQDRIKFAFSRNQRTTKNIANFHDFKIYLLNGKYTENLGVIEHQYETNEIIRVTDIERTLIDIIVRPNYSGGIFEVLKAYQNAYYKVSINKLCSYLKKINFIYPYHQIIGFLLDKTKLYKENQINLLKQFEIKYDFFLTYGAKDLEYSKEWRLFYPKGF